MLVVRFLAVIAAALSVIALAGCVFAALIGGIWLEAVFASFILLIGCVVAMLWVSVEYLSIQLLEACSTPRYTIAEKIDFDEISTQRPVLETYSVAEHSCTES